MKEKGKIEKFVAEEFLKHYNRDYLETFEIVESSDAPDIKCQNSNGSKLNLEITLTEDRPNDIAAMLGRSPHKNLEVITKNRENKTLLWEQVSSLSDTVLPILIQRVKVKLLKDYGSNVALVIKDTSGCNWDWNFVLDKIKKQISDFLTKNNSDKTPFDKGIWILSGDGDKTYKIN